MFRTTLALAALLASTSAVAQGAAGAASTAEAGAGTDLETIIVTAQKRDQRAFDVPITLSALSGDRLRALGISEYDELSAFVPGLLVQEQSANNPGFVIRGITSDTGSAQQAARVTVYYNGIDVSRSRGVYQDLYDLERVEVVKGPQATLFGTAAAVGAVSVISARPREGFEASLLGGIGNEGQRRVDAVLNASTGGGTVRMRAALSWKRYDGFVPNIAGEPGTLSASLGLPLQDDLNGKNNLGARFSLRLLPGERTTVDIIATYDRQRNTGTSFKSGSLPPSVGDTRPTTPAELGGALNSGPLLGLPKLGLRRDLYDVNLTVNHELSDALTLTSITGYRRFDSLEVFDADGSGLQYLEFAEDARGKQFSQEVRVNFTGERVRGFAGANYFWEDGLQRVPFATEEGAFIACSRSRFPAALQALIPVIDCRSRAGLQAAANFSRTLTRGAVPAVFYNSEFTNFGINDATSVFADATFTVTPRLELTAGLRYVYENRESRFASVQPNLRLFQLAGLPVAFAPLGQTTFGQQLRAKRDYSDFLPRFNMLFRATDELNLYATISKGRRSPFINLSAAAPVAGQAVASRADIPAEIVWNYEAGAKLATGDLSASVGVFYQAYDNFGVSVFDPGRGIFVPSNGGSARNFGVEAESQLRLSRALSLFGSLGYIDAKIDDKPENGTFAGQRFRLQPKWQAAAGATLTLPLDAAESVELFASPNYTYRSRIFFEQPNSALISERPIGLANVRAGVRSADGRWQLNGYATNLFNVRYIIDAGNTGGGFGYPTFIAGAPRFYGVEASVRF